MKYLRDKETLKQFGEHLRKVRMSKKISQEELAFKADMEYSQVSRIERGIINTSISHVSKLAKALGVPLSELFEFD